MIESRQLAWPVYLVSAALILIPLSDVFTSLFPWRVLEPRWRFGAVGLISNSLLIPTLGLLLAFVMAALNDHRITRRIIGITALLASSVCLIALVMFALDAVQTRAAVRPEMRVSFNVASVAAAVKTLIAGVTAFAIGWAALRRGRSRVSDSKDGDVPILASIAR